MSGYTKEDKHAHDTFRKDAIKSIKEGQLQKAARSYEAAIGNCAYLSTMLEAADLYLRMGYHQKEARDMTTRVLKAGPTHSQQRHATKILHQVLEPTAAPQGAVALPHEVAMGAAATAASEGAHHEVPTPPPAAAAPATAVMVLPPARVHAHAPVELPVGWAHFLTPDGDAYFHCEATGETLWEPPASSHTLAAAESIFRTPGALAGSEPPSAIAEAAAKADELFRVAPPPPTAAFDSASAADALFGVAPQYGSAAADAAGRPFDGAAEASKPI